MFVHHPNPTFNGVEPHGARLVRFHGGVAEVTLPGLLQHYRGKAGYQVLDQGQVPTADGEQFVDLSDLTVAELKDYAGEHGIDLTGAVRKDDIVDTIADAPLDPIAGSTPDGDAWVSDGLDD